ncbi:EAL domain-containing protein [Domibacillus sp. A3M-37]|uniref:bifunctional diguanylate cyclase/phosphodiesterase n=1 Tax=Domibacillus sp. A3M-37 TaxID=2962037 RepID=UPI0020B6B442|nr:EAL domain-containing protein [Domibacillus sp. A3M-37]MCP3764347.1 EAL domain-containing protein [Domibacillus sp. A3M-37]
MKNIFGSSSLLDVYQSLFEQDDEISFAMDIKGKIQLMNKAAAQILGYTSAEFFHMDYKEVIPKEHIAAVQAHFRHVFKGNKSSFRMTFRNKEGDIIHLSVNAVPIYSEGRIHGAIGIGRVRTEEQYTSELLNGQNAILQMIAKGAPFRDVLRQIVETMEHISPGHPCSILLLDDEKKHLFHGAAPHLPDEYISFINGLAIGENQGSCGTAAFLKKPVIVTDIENDPRCVQHKDIALKYDLKACWSTPIFDDDQQVIGTFAMYYDRIAAPTKADKQIIQEATDLTSIAIQHYKAKEQIQKLAYHDHLTGLPNRRHFRQTLENAIALYPDHTHALFFLDLDRFKFVNDSFGHKTGDELLTMIVDRIQSCLGEHTLFSREGGDEFTIWVGQTSSKAAAEIAESILATFREPFSLHENDLFMTASIGISLYPQDGLQEQELFRKADIAMYEAKKHGRNTFQFYTNLLDRQSLKKLKMESELRSAIARNELTLVYQPIQHLCTGQVHGAEALIRWNSRLFGFVSPIEFIPLAEETDLIIPIGEWVIQTACQQFKTWQEQGLILTFMSVNLSISQFYQPNLAGTIETILKETGVEPSQLTCEITESMTMDTDNAAAVLRRLKDIGVFISIDDFGTGYSSLSYLQKLPLDTLKIDQSFVRDIAVNESSEKIATTIILMAHHLGLHVVAEGVETEEQLAILKEYQCDAAQGYLLGRPVPPDEFFDQTTHISS